MLVGNFLSLLLLKCIFLSSAYEFQQSFKLTNVYIKGTESFSKVVFIINQKVKRRMNLRRTEITEK